MGSQAARRSDRESSRRCTGSNRNPVLFISNFIEVVQNCIGQVNGLSLSVSNIVHPLLILYPLQLLSLINYYHLHLNLLL